MTDFRALCEELTEHLSLLNEPPHELVVRAQSALAQPEPEVPTVMQIIELAEEIEAAELGQVHLVRAALARWTTPALAEVRGSLQPTPVSERLPSQEDCDTEGRCWLLTVEDDYPQWRLHSIQGAQPGGAMIWVPVDGSSGFMVDCFYTSHWLPANALPVPSGEVG